MNYGYNEASKSSRGHNRVWVMDEYFACAREAEQKVKSNEVWTFGYFHNTKSGRKVYYRCRYSQKERPCNAYIYLFYHSDREGVTLYRTPCEHTHQTTPIIKTSRGIGTETRKKIQVLYKNGINKPTEIHQALKSEYFGRNTPVPSISQINCFIVDWKRRGSIRGDINQEQLRKWLDEKIKVIPSNENEPFIVDFYHNCNVLGSTESIFRFFITTRRLLANVFRTRHICIDSVNKLTWKRFPIFLVGTNDLDNRFHSFGLAMTDRQTQEDFTFIFNSLVMGSFKTFQLAYKPDVLVSDPNMAVAQGFERIFGGEGVTIRRLCWFHAYRKMKKELVQFIKNKEIRINLMNDIRNLQKSPTRQMFMYTSDLFIQKWSNKSSETDEFIAHFHKYWLSENPNWYLGCAHHVPVYTAALESTRNSLKNLVTFRGRLSLQRFLVSVENLVKKLSSCYNNNNNSNSSSDANFSQNASITEKRWLEAHEWLSVKAKIVKLTPNLYFTHSAIINPSNAIFEMNIRKILELNYECFDDYVDLKMYHWLEIPDLNANVLSTGRCSCDEYLGNFICPHLIGLALRLKLVQAPVEIASLRFTNSNVTTSNGGHETELAATATLCLPVLISNSSSSAAASNYSFIQAQSSQQSEQQQQELGQEDFHYFGEKKFNVSTCLTTNETDMPPMEMKSLRPLAHAETQEDDDFFIEFNQQEVKVKNEFFC